MERLLTAGYAAIDVIKGKEYLGGAAAGIAINGKRLGVNTGLCALFGSDKWSNQYWDFLVTNGIDLSLSLKNQQARLPEFTAHPDDRNFGWNEYGLSTHYKEMNIDSATVNKYPVIHLASTHYFLTEKIINVAKPSLLSYTPGPEALLDPFHYLNPNFIRASDVIFFNEIEWFNAKKAFLLEKPEDLVDLGPRIAVITLGARGSQIIYREGEKNISQHIPVPEKKGETTGAGDAYSLGFIIGILNGLRPIQSGELGSTLAIMAISRNGVLIEEAHLKKFKQDFL